MLTVENKHRLVGITGFQGLGKRSVGDYALKYCVDRGYFKDGVFNVELGARKTCHGFLKQLYESMRLKLDKLEDLIEIIKNSDIVLYIH